ncbi:cytochrome P450 [Macrophomina phaseolina]|uniref:Cytochrome P450 n=1 Tax=Macrophomina phaseolina TaxID=35725 RepID=A0ABQ8G993_9PEZI|nr:cytochrome P450 [Macrophomina phaseolina]
MASLNASAQATPQMPSTQSYHQYLEAHATAIQLLTLKNVIAAIALYIFVSSVVAAARQPKYPSTVPWVGKEGKGWLAEVRATFKSVVHVRKWVQEGYDKYSKQNRTFILPSAPGQSPQLVVPTTQMPWLLEHPDSVLSTSAAHYDSLHGDYSFLHPQILADPYHEHVIHRSLARNLSALVPSIEDEVRRAMDDVFGTDGDAWRSVNVWDALLALVPRLTNRMMVGAPLCRDPHYLANMVGFTNDVVRNIVLLGLTPEPLKPLVGPLAALPTRLHYNQTAKHTLPLVRRRLADIAAKERGDAGYDDWTEPNDYVSWHIRLARHEGRGDELDPVRITQRLLPLNFAAIHTTAMTAHATLLDLLSSDPADGFLDGIAEEAARVYAEHGGAWSKDGLARLLRADSAVRESMRLSTFAQTLVGRKVVAREGVTNKAEGWHVPYGGMLALPLYSRLHDPDVFSEPMRYDAFRHSREREMYEAKPAEEKRDREEGLRLKQKGMVTTGDAHFPWGHGRHAW